MIALNAPTTHNVRVKYTIAGKATKGKDYQKIGNSLLIPAGNVSGIIEILPLDDTKHEGAETVQIKLLLESGKSYKALSGRRASATVQILDND